MKRDIEIEFNARIDLTRLENPQLETRLTNWGYWARGRVEETIEIKYPPMNTLIGEPTKTNDNDRDPDEDSAYESKPVPIDVKDALIIAAVVCKPDFKREWRQILHIAYIHPYVPDRLLSDRARTSPDHFVDLLRQARREISRKA